MTVKLLEEAKTDLLSIIDYYQQIDDDLAAYFYEELLFIESILIANPQAFQIRYFDVRGVPLKRFPYMIYYRIVGDDIIINLIVSTHQSPVKHRKQIKKRK